MYHVLVVVVKSIIYSCCCCGENIFVVGILTFRDQNFFWSTNLIILLTWCKILLGPTKDWGAAIVTVVIIRNLRKQPSLTLAVKNLWYYNWFKLRCCPFFFGSQTNFFWIQQKITLIKLNLVWITKISTQFLLAHNFLLEYQTNWVIQYYWSWWVLFKLVSQTTFLLVSNCMILRICCRCMMNSSCDN